MLENMPRNGVVRIVAMLLADHDAIAGEQFLPPLDSRDLNAFDIELGDITSLWIKLHPLHQRIERHHGDFLAGMRSAGDGLRLVLAGGLMRERLGGSDRGLHRREAAAIAGCVSRQPREIRGRWPARARAARAIRAARSENRPVAEIGAAIDQRVVGIGDAAKEHLDVEFVAIAGEQQEAPIAITEREGKYRILVEADLDRLLRRQRSRPPAPCREATEIPRRTARCPGLHRADQHAVARTRSGKAAGQTVERQSRVGAVFRGNRMHGRKNVQIATLISFRSDRPAFGCPFRPATPDRRYEAVRQPASGYASILPSAVMLD